MALPSPESLQKLVAELSEAAKAYSASPDLSGYMSRVNIIDKATKVTQTLISPEQMPNYHGRNMAEVIAIRTFMKLKALEKIPLDGSISLRDLAKATGAQESLLERLARVLVATGFLDQADSDGGRYKHTKFSRAYTSSPGPGVLFKVQYDEWFIHMSKFPMYLEARNQVSHAVEPDDPTYNPYTWSSGRDGTPVWAIMAQDPERLQNFQIGLSGIDAAIPVVGHFDFSQLVTTEEARMELVDVGGGHGACLKQILEKYPQLEGKKCVLQDNPDVINLARKSGILPADLVLMEHDFRTEQPVKGAKAYFLRMIMHDYADAVCVSILSRLAEAMAPDSRVLIAEIVMPQRVGEADFPAAILDHCVMTMGGKERTENGFRAIMEPAGLELVKVWRIPGVPGGCVEGRLKREFRG